MKALDFKPGLITLYDIRSDDSFKGELVFKKNDQIKLSSYLDEVLDISSLLIALAYKRLLLVGQDLITFNDWFIENLQNYFTKSRIINLTRNTAVVLLIISTIGIADVLLPIGIAGIKYSLLPKLQNNFQNIDYKLDTTLITSENKPKLQDQISDFRIVIPKINLESKVIPNVDLSNENSYLEELKKGVAHAKGSYFPGEQGPVFLFSHSTDSLFDVSQYNAKFFGLKDLKNGDEINIYFEGKEYEYIINGKKIISPDKLDEIRNTKSNLVLSTCWPFGTDWQRLVVFASTK